MAEGDTPIRVVLADAQEVARIGTRRVLEEAGLAVAAETERGEKALRLTREHAPDVLICEMDLPGLSGLQVSAKLSEEGAPVQVLALSAYDDERYVRYLMENDGLAGYLKKSEAPRRIVAAVRALACGEREGGWLSPKIAQKAMSLRQRTDGPEQLDARGVTEREREVLRLMTKGHSNAEIGKRLFITENTVRTHVSHLYDKLNVATRPKVMAWAWEHGLTEKGDRRV